MQRAVRLTLLLLLLVAPACSHGAGERRELIADDATLATVAQAYETGSDAVAGEGVAPAGMPGVLEEALEAPRVGLSDDERDGTRALVKAVQARLIAIGFAPGYPDGALGDRTRIALKDFQRFHRLPETGEADGSTLAALFGTDEPGAPDGEIHRTRGEDERGAPTRGRPQLSRMRTFGFGAGVGFLCAAAIAAFGFVSRRWRD